MKSLQTSEEIFARKCSTTGKGMNKGWIFGDGEYYCKSKKDAEEKAIEVGFLDLTDAYNKDYAYYTEWEEITEGDEYFNAAGEVIGTV